MTDTRSTRGTQRSASYKPICSDGDCSCSDSDTECSDSNTSKYSIVTCDLSSDDVRIRHGSTYPPISCEEKTKSHCKPQTSASFSSTASSSTCTTRPPRPCSSTTSESSTDTSTTSTTSTTSSGKSKSSRCSTSTTSKCSSDSSASSASSGSKPESGKCCRPQTQYVCNSTGQGSSFNATLSPLCDITTFANGTPRGQVEFLMRRKNREVTLQLEGFSGITAEDGVCYLTVNQSICNLPAYPINSNLIRILRNGCWGSGFIEIDPHCSKQIKIFLDVAGEGFTVPKGDKIIVPGTCISWLAKNDS